MKKNLLFLLAFVLPIPLLADTIYTWGYGEIFYDVLLGIAAFANDGYLIKIAGGLGMIALAFKMFDGRSAPIMEIGKFFLMTLLVYVAFLTAGTGGVYRHTIQDKVTGYTNVVDGIPIGVGKTLGLLTAMEDAIANGMESVFTTPTTTQYRNAGLGFPLVAHSNMAKAHATDPYVQRSVDDFIANCLLYDIMDGSINPNTLFNSGDLPSAIASSSSRMTNIFTAANPVGTLVTCEQASADLIANIDAMLPEVKSVVAAESGFITDGSIAAFDTKAADIANLYFGIAKTSNEYLRQSVTMNLIGDGLNNVAKTTGIDPAALAYGTSLAERTAQNNFTISGELAKKYLPLLKGILTMLIIGIAWMLAVMAVMFFDFQYMRMFLSLMIFLSLWTPLAVILNFITDIYLSKVLTPVGQVGDWYTMANKGIVDSEVMSTLAWLGYLGWSIPMLAYAIAKKSDHGFVALTSGLTGAMSSGVSQAAGEVARGNIRLGNVGIGKQEVIDEGSRFARDQYGLHSEQSINQGGTQFAQDQIVNNGNVTTTQKSLSSHTEVATNNAGEITQASLPNVTPSVQTAFTKSLGESMEQIDSKQRTQQEAIGTVASAAISDANSTDLQHGKTAGTGVASKESVAMQEVFTKSLNNMSADKQSAMEQEMTAHGFGGGVAAGQTPGAGRMGNIAKGLRLNGQGNWEYKDTNGKTHELSESLQTEVKNAVNKTTASEFASSKDFRETFSHLSNSNHSVTAGTGWSDTETLSNAYSETLSEKAALNKLQSEGLNLSQDRKIALMKEAIHDGMVEDLMGSERISKEDATRQIDSTLREQGDGRFTQEQVRSGINYLDKAYREANSGSGEKLSDLMNNATKEDNPLKDTKMPTENQFTGVKDEVQGNLTKGERDASATEDKLEAVTKEAKQKQSVDASIDGIFSQVKGREAAIKGADVNVKGMDEVQNNVKKGMEEIDGKIAIGKTEAAIAAVASAFNGLLPEKRPGGAGEADKVQTRGEKLQQTADETLKDREAAKSNYEKQVATSEGKHASNRLSELITNQQDAYKPGSKEYNRLEELKQKAAGGHGLNADDVKALNEHGLSKGAMSESGIHFDRNGAVDMADTGANVKKQAVAEAQMKFADTDVAHKVAEHTNELHKANPNITEAEVKESIKEKFNGWVNDTMHNPEVKKYSTKIGNGVDKVGNVIDNLINNPATGERFLGTVSELGKGLVWGSIFTGTDMGHEVDPAQAYKTLETEKQQFLKLHSNYNPNTQDVKSTLTPTGWEFEITNKSTLGGKK